MIRTIRTVVVLPALIALSLAGCSALGFGSKGDSTKKGNGSLSEADLAAQREARFGSSGIPTAEGEGAFHDIRFDFDSDAINDQGRADIEYNYEVMRSNPQVRVILEGHTDERGTTEYNMALGAKRSRAVKDVLLSLGVPQHNLDSISYGEEIPLDQGHEEDAWGRNRRVHLSPTK